MLSSRGASTRAHRGRWWSRNLPPLRGSRNPAMNRCPTLNTPDPFYVACASDGVKQKTSEGITRPLCQEQVHSAHIHLHSVFPKPDPASVLCPERPHCNLQSHRPNLGDGRNREEGEHEEASPGTSWAVIIAVWQGQGLVNDERQMLRLRAVMSFGHLIATGQFLVGKDANGVLEAICALGMVKNFGWADTSSHGTCEDRDKAAVRGAVFEYNAEVNHKTFDPFVVCSF